MKVYLDTRDWWIGYYRGDTHHYVCPLPCVVIRWRRRLARNAPRWADGDPWKDWTLVVDTDGTRYAVYSRLLDDDVVLRIEPRPPDQVHGTGTTHVALIADRRVELRVPAGPFDGGVYRAPTIQRQAMPIPGGTGSRFGQYPPWSERMVGSRHVHDAACVFGSPTCWKFAEPPKGTR